MSKRFPWEIPHSIAEEPIFGRTVRKNVDIHSVDLGATSNVPYGVKAAKKLSAALTSIPYGYKHMLVAGLGTAALIQAAVLVERNINRNREQETYDLKNADRAEAAKKSWVSRRQKYGKSGRSR
jgi:hypothetical protein